MRCPACDGFLTEIFLEDMGVDICQESCAGVWFDCFELKKFEGPGERDASVLIELKPASGIEIDPLRNRFCPKCKGDVKLERRNYGRQRQVELDQCSLCWGVWLDRGELESIREINKVLPEDCRQISSLELQTARAEAKIYREGSAAQPMTDEEMEACLRGLGWSLK